MEENLIRELDDASFLQAVASGVVLVDFFADWCAPCRTLAPIFKEVAEKMAGNATFAKLDIDRGTDVATKFQVTSVPTLILFKGGKEVNRLMGLRDAGAIEEFVRGVL